MSTIKVDRLVANDGISPVTLTKQSAAKAWVYFDTFIDSSNPVVRGSLNVSSLIDETGEDGINLTNAMSDAFYAPTAGGGKDGANPANRSLQVTVVDSSTMNTEFYTTANAQTEGQVHVAAHGDLA